MLQNISLLLSQIPLPPLCFSFCVSPSCVIRTSPGMKALSLCFPRRYRPYLFACYAVRSTHTLTYMFTALGFHIWCAILLLLLLLLLKRPNLGHKLPVFLIQAVKTTNWGKGSFLLHRNWLCIIVLTLNRGQIRSESPDRTGGIIQTKTLQQQT